MPEFLEPDMADSFDLFGAPPASQIADAPPAAGRRLHQDQFVVAEISDFVDKMSDLPQLNAKPILLDGTDSDSDAGPRTVFSSSDSASSDAENGDDGPAQEVLRAPSSQLAAKSDDATSSIFVNVFGQFRQSTRWLLVKSSGIGHQFRSLFYQFFCKVVPPKVLAFLFNLAALCGAIILMIFANKNLTFATADFICKFASYMLSFFNLAFPGQIRGLIDKYTFSGGNSTPLDQSKYRTYLACLQCKKLYTVANGFTTHPDGTKTPIVCTFKEFANGQNCGAPLCKITCDKTGRRTCVSIDPSQRVSFFSLRDEIQRVLNLPLAKSNLHSYMTETLPIGQYRNVWDGRVWRWFRTAINTKTGKEYLRGDVNYMDLALGLNLDGFQPFENQVYSVTAVYITILNLPADIRNRPEYMILLAVLPGPEEPSVRVFSSYTQPLVAELTALSSKEGVTLTIAGHQRPTWSYLILISADWPVRCPP